MKKNYVVNVHYPIRDYYYIHRVWDLTDVSSPVYLGCVESDRTSRVTKDELIHFISEKTGLEINDDNPYVFMEAKKTVRDNNDLTVKTCIKDAKNEKDFLIEIGYDKEGFQKHQEEYQIAQKEAHDAFYKDCCENVGLEPDSKSASAIFRKAWEDGHSGGYHEVWTKMEDYVEVFEELLCDD